MCLCRQQTSFFITDPEFTSRSENLLLHCFCYKTSWVNIFYTEIEAGEELKNMGLCPIKGQSSLTVLENPVEPAQPDSMIISLCNYPSFGCTDFSMCIGEQLTILSDDGDFMSVKSTTTGRDIYIPTTYTAKVTHRWLFSGIRRYSATELLMQPNNPNGAFLIRESETNRDCYTLSVLKKTYSSHPDCVQHYCISHLLNGWLFISPRVTFPSLHHLVEHYSEDAYGLCCCLTKPCFIQGLDNAKGTRPSPISVRTPTINWKDISRSMIFKRKRTASRNSLVSEGLREAITSYLQITEGSNDSWET